MYSVMMKGDNKFRIKTWICTRLSKIKASRNGKVHTGNSLAIAYFELSLTHLEASK